MEENAVRLPSGRIGINDLPAVIDLNLSEPNQIVFGVLAFIGLAVAVIAGGFIAFGPDRVYYSIADGMSFWQVWEAYPGPIASVGAALASMAIYWPKEQRNKNNRLARQQITSRLDIAAGDVPDGYTVLMENLGNYRFKISLAEAQQPAAAE